MKNDFICGLSHPIGWKCDSDGSYTEGDWKLLMQGPCRELFHSQEAHRPDPGHHHWEAGIADEFCRGRSRVGLHWEFAVDTIFI